jgi:DNA-binding MarR family transcriptional regulator
MCHVATRTHTSNRSAALIDHLARRNRAGSEAALAPLGLRPRHLLALTVLRDHGPTGQQAMAQTLRIDRTNLVGLLNELEEGGLLARTRDAADRRRHLVDLTDAGRARLGEADAVLQCVEDQVLGGLDAAERAQLYHLLRQATRGHALDCLGGA